MKVKEKGEIDLELSGMKTYNLLFRNMNSLVNSMEEAGNHSIQSPFSFTKREISFH